LVVWLCHEDMGPTQPARHNPTQMHGPAPRRPLIIFLIVNQSANCCPWVATCQPKSDNSSASDPGLRRGLE